MKVAASKRHMIARLNPEQKGLPKANWMHITPETAEDMLKRLDSNRRLITTHVTFLAEEIRENRWRVNGDTIRFSNRRLLDGQHRLHAVIQADKPIWALIVEEIPDESFDTIDTGRTRGAGDILSLHMLRCFTRGHSLEFC
jgi:hypothetical protein